MNAWMAGTICVWTYYELLQASGAPSLALSFPSGFWQNPRCLGGVTKFTFGMPLVLGNEMELASDRN
jgi:hypothetical protein